MKTCEECGCNMFGEINYNTAAHPICGLCWDELHIPQIDDHSDADSGL